MSNIFQARGTDLDVEMMIPGDKLPCTVGPTLRSTGWRGGQWVMYSTSATQLEFEIEASDGTATCGYILFQSEDYNILGEMPGSDFGSPENWTAQQPRTNVAANVVTVIFGNSRSYFKVFETEALAGGVRAGGAITYALNDSLYISENGLLCNDSVAALQAAGIADPVKVGIVSAVPSTRNGNRLGADIQF